MQKSDSRRILKNGLKIKCSKAKCASVVHLFAIMELSLLVSSVNWYWLGKTLSYLGRTSPAEFDYWKQAVLEALIHFQGSTKYFPAR